MVLSSDAPTTPRLPPGPSASAIVQSLQAVRTPAHFFDECRRKYGDSFTVRFVGQPPYVFLCAKEDVKEVLGGPADDYLAGEANEYFQFLLGRYSITQLDRARHMRERKLMMPSFHGERLVSYGERMRDATLRHMQRWVPGKVFTAYGFAQDVTLDIILDTIFGIPPGPARERFRSAVVEFLEQCMTPVAMLSWLYLPATPLRDFLVHRLAPTADRLPGASAFGRFLPLVPLARATRELDELLYTDIQRRRAEGVEGRDDVMSMLMSARDEEGNGLTDDELHDEMVSLLIGGHETTAIMLAWSLLMLAEHPEVVARIRSELKETLGDGPLDATRTRSLEYLDAAIKETLRLFPIAGGVVRKLARPTRIGNNYLPAGTIVAPSIYLMQRDPAVWPDPTRFDPGRFLERKPKSYEYFPFGGGLRTCVGMTFSLFELRIILATMLSAADLRRASTETVRLAARGFFWGPSSEIPMVLTRWLARPDTLSAAANQPESVRHGA